MLLLNVMNPQGPQIQVLANIAAEERDLKTLKFYRSYLRTIRASFH